MSQSNNADDRACCSPLPARRSSPCFAPEDVLGPFPGGKTELDDSPLLVRAHSVIADLNISTTLHASELGHRGVIGWERPRGRRVGRAAARVARRGLGRARARAAEGLRRRAPGVGAHHADRTRDRCARACLRARAHASGCRCGAKARGRRCPSLRMAMYGRGRAAAHVWLEAGEAASVGARARRGGATLRCAASVRRDARRRAAARRRGRRRQRRGARAGGHRA